MKQFFLLLCIALIFTQCDKSEKAEPTRPSGFILDIQKNEKLSTGEIVAKSTIVGAVHIWKANGKDFQIKSTSDAIGGYAWDRITSTSIKSDITRISDHIAENVEPGSYLVFVVLGSNIGVGSLASSYTTFEVKSGEIASVKKVFTTHVTTGSYEDWNKTE